jgi:hypothetical protein
MKNLNSKESMETVEQKLSKLSRQELGEVVNDLQRKIDSGRFEGRDKQIKHLALDMYLKKFITITADNLTVFPKKDRLRKICNLTVDTDNIDELSLSLEIQNRLSDGLKGETLVRMAEVLNIDLSGFKIIDDRL